MHPLIAASLALWWISGVSGFCFWWTREFDLTLSGLWLAGLVGVMGPGTFIYGWLVMGPPATRPPIVLIRSRKHRTGPSHEASGN